MNIESNKERRLVLCAGSEPEFRGSKSADEDPGVDD
jgi:hypothetical protein